MLVGTAGRPASQLMLGGSQGNMAAAASRSVNLQVTDDAHLLGLATVAGMEPAGMPAPCGSRGGASRFGKVAFKDVSGPLHGPWLPSAPYAPVRPDSDLPATPVTHGGRHDWEATVSTAAIDRHAAWSAARASSAAAQAEVDVARPGRLTRSLTALAAPLPRISAQGDPWPKPRRKAHPDPLVVLTRSTRRAHLQRRLEHRGDDFGGEYSFPRGRSEAGSPAPSEAGPPRRRHRSQPPEWWIVATPPSEFSMNVDSVEQPLPSHSRTRSRRPAQSAGTSQGRRPVAGGQK